MNGKLGSLDAPINGPFRGTRALTYNEARERFDWLSSRLLLNSTFDLWGCWTWDAGVGSHGYGDLYVPKYVHVLTHVLSWMLFKGPVPDGHLVLHTCDNHRCWRPNHLFTGPHSANTKDMMLKGRHRPGMKGRGRSGIPYIHWDETTKEWKVKKHATQYPNRGLIEKRGFKTVEDAHIWAQSQGLYTTEISQ